MCHACNWTVRVIARMHTCKWLFFSLLAKKFPAISKGLNLKLLQGSMPPDPLVYSCRRI